MMERCGCVCSDVARRARKIPRRDEGSALRPGNAAKVGTPGRPGMGIARGPVPTRAQGRFSPHRAGGTRSRIGGWAVGVCRRCGRRAGESSRCEDPAPTVGRLRGWHCDPNGVPLPPPCAPHAAHGVRGFYNDAARRTVIRLRRAHGCPSWRKCRSARQYPAMISPQCRL